MTPCRAVTPSEKTLHSSQSPVVSQCREDEFHYPGMGAGWRYRLYLVRSSTGKNVLQNLEPIRSPKYTTLKVSKNPGSSQFSTYLSKVKVLIPRFLKISQM